MMSDPNIKLPYKDDNDDSPYTVNSEEEESSEPKEEESLEDKVDESKKQS